MGLFKYLYVHHAASHVYVKKGGNFDLVFLSFDLVKVLGIEKWTILVMKRGKRHITERMELLNQDKIRRHGEKETYKYLEILEAHTRGDERKN